MNDEDPQHEYTQCPAAAVAASQQCLATQLCGVEGLLSQTMMQSAAAETAAFCCLWNVCNLCCCAVVEQSHRVVGKQLLQGSKLITCAVMLSTVGGDYSHRPLCVHTAYSLPGLTVSQVCLHAKQMYDEGGIRRCNSTA
jgi:hypothetical protein